MVLGSKFALRSYWRAEADTALNRLQFMAYCNARSLRPIVTVSSVKCDNLNQQFFDRIALYTKQPALVTGFCVVWALGYLPPRWEFLPL